MGKQTKKRKKELLHNRVLNMLSTSITMTNCNGVCRGCGAKVNTMTYVKVKNRSVYMCDDCKEKMLSYFEQKNSEDVSFNLYKPMPLDNLVKHITSSDADVSFGGKVDLDDFGSYYDSARYKQDHNER